MKRFKFSTIIMLFVAFLFGTLVVKADNKLPDNMTTDNYEIINYITYKTEKNTDGDYRVLLKKAKDGTYLYCIDLEKTFDANVNYTKKGTLDDGFVYILNNIPNTGDSKKDYYITQMAVYYYEDYLNNNNNNLQQDVKKYIISVAENDNAKGVTAETRDVCKKILALLEGAKRYAQIDGYLMIDSKVVTYTIKDGYYVSSDISISSKNVGKLKYSMDNVPKGTQVVKGSKDNTVVVKIPTSAIPEGQKLTFTLKVNTSYTKQKAYYYYADGSHQRLLYGKTENTTNELNDSLTMTIKNYEENYKIHISKTDITQSKEIPGATLVVKDSKGNVVETWVSTDKTHEITLNPGEYTLTETIAPEGYKKSSTTITFVVDANGVLYEKVNDKYYPVDKINMINELKDVTSFAKKDSVTDKYVSGAVMVIKNSKGEVVNEFTSTDSVYQLTLNAGDYTLSEKSAPDGYVLSNETIRFRITEDGTLQVKDNKGDYQDSVMVVFYNTPKNAPSTTTITTKGTTEKVVVPSTGSNGTIVMMIGAALLIAGVVYVYKTTKEC